MKLYILSGGGRVQKRVGAQSRYGYGLVEIRFVLLTSGR